MADKIRGLAFKIGDDINTDYIISARYLDLYEAKELGAHLFEGLEPDHRDRMKGCAVLVAGKNLGLGSAREQAPNALKGAGFRVVIAKSAARIFYRNAINVGLPVVFCAELVDLINDREEVEVDLRNGVILMNDQRKYSFPPIPEPVRKILEAGGMFPFLKSMAPQR
jgi:3-isopropylmalate dehydratase small subunit